MNELGEQLAFDVPAPSGRVAVAPPPEAQPRAVSADEAAQPDADPRWTAVQVARQAAVLATAAADSAMDATYRAGGATAARREAAMHSAHAEAVDAERYARYAAEDAAAAPLGTLLNFARQALGAAERAQLAAGVPMTTGPLVEQIRAPETGAERRAREAELRRMEAEYEAQLQAETGMDLINRVRLEVAKRTAAEQVPKLGWSAGLLSAVERAATGRVMWRDGRPWIGRRPVAAQRVRLLVDAGFLTVDAPAVSVTGAGELALYLVHLAPASAIHPDDRAAYEARLAAVPRAGTSRDDRKAIARRLPRLAPALVSRFQYPLTLTGHRATSPSKPSIG